MIPERAPKRKGHPAVSIPPRVVRRQIEPETPAETREPKGEHDDACEDDPMRKFTSVAAYLKAVPPAPRAALQQLRKTIKAAAPEATELISYGIPAFKHHGMLVYYAAFKDHCSLFAMSGAILKANKRALAPYKTSKGTIQFTVDKPLPTALVRKLVKARVAENEARR